VFFKHKYYTTYFLILQHFFNKKSNFLENERGFSVSVVGIIAEYNPFHKGHQYQLDLIRERFGTDTIVVAVMSGSFTQRGEVAAFDKVTRAKAAVLSGVDLVLELPFPYSCSSAEFFARAGISILDRLGVVDYLSFGSECGDIETLKKAALINSNESFNKASHDPDGHAKKLAQIYSSEISDNDIFSSNNILGIEYIKAISALGSNIIPITHLRKGAAYNSPRPNSDDFRSAMSIRTLLSEGNLSALDYLPNASKEVLSEAISRGEGPTEQGRLDSALISSLRLNSPASRDKIIHDAAGGLYNRIRSASFHADSISSLIELAKTKKYTIARIRRAIWYSFFGVTSSEVKAPPSYTQVLAMSENGAALLKRIKKLSDLPVLTKPSRTDGLSPEELLAKELSDAADSIFQLTKPTAIRGDAGLMFTPFVKKSDIMR